ncbi:MAG: hypothetical protein IM638_04015 [Bacteroidetes bacterium]|nr:hypothetical protein [Bacteroidota bacterium]
MKILATCLTVFLLSASFLTRQSGCVSNFSPCLIQDKIDSVRSLLSPTDTLVVYLKDGCENERTIICFREQGQLCALAYSDSVRFEKIYGATLSSVFKSIDIPRTAVRKHEDKLVFKSPILGSCGCNVSLIYIGKNRFIVEYGGDCDYQLDRSRNNSRRSYFKKLDTCFSILNFTGNTRN